ncbi:MAG: Ala-tRNA(Pro) hydrolase [Pelagibacteraceae bacterium TMED237]|nr:MAG: Ala-tRNA(Pro) hydrolase [Pelagibacteraceae bacterium TMED237]|tara:strand:- start:794 stop:1495 length:702 start_codon:yes stop_codon:yes gene_type:complete
MANLFEINSYLAEFKSKIIKINREEKMLELKETAFYAKSGGQPGDIGEIIADNQNIKVLETIKKEGKIINIVNRIENLKENSNVIGKINWDIRYKHMRMHTALHLMCSIIPLSVTGGQIGYEKSRLDFNDPNKVINKEDLEKKINLLVEDDHEVISEEIESQILEEKPELVRTMSVKPPQIDGKIRLIKIGNVDLQPCGGTHVKSTIEIGKIKIGKIENKGKMNRRVNLILLN